MTNKQALREAAEKATPGEWRRASTRFNGITAQSAYPLCGKEDILASAAEKRDAEFIAAANPATVLALLDELEAAEKRIAELETRTITVKFEPIPMEELGNRRDGKKHPYMFGAGYNSAVVHCESVLHQACAAAGIGVKGE
ncbi:ead/Ea22-like family protein [Citrobacter freundii]|uniref:ead/Ea22-like family protein n=1 Tax=Citrobacter freundii TaxID=546 RepID=UPI0019085447|nr:ead/Ea22-like family protein [Citrobacter freundii]MBJ9192490.1 ead/Ea22-like family protein [Citrobacter freundii]